MALLEAEALASVVLLVPEQADNTSGKQLAAQPTLK
jgi:hypothetical protein